MSDMRLPQDTIAVQQKRHNDPFAMSYFANDRQIAWYLFMFRAIAFVNENIRKGTGMRVIGLDPGLRHTGYGIVDVMGSRIKHVANGTCRSTGGDLSARLLSLFEQLSDVITRYTPDTAAVEHTFVNKDAAGTLKLGQARAIALLVPARAGLSVAEYAPNAVKKVVVGVGHADKSQVEHMVRLQLPGAEITGPDAADALAIALCHSHHAQFTGRLDAAIAAAGAGA